jgi:mannose PTS system EIIA component
MMQPLCLQGEETHDRLVIITHGGLAHEFRLALELIVGAQDRLETIAVGPDDDLEKRRADILATVKRVDDGHGVVVATDMFGGTPSNLALTVLEEGRVEIIAGVNLPLLIKLAQLRGGCSLKEAAATAMQAGRKYITVAGQILEGQCGRPDRPTRAPLPCPRSQSLLQQAK